MTHVHEEVGGVVVGLAHEVQLLEVLQAVLRRALPTTRTYTCRVHQPSKVVDCGLQQLYQGDVMVAVEAGSVCGGPTW